MAATWYCRVSNGEFGPYTLEQVIALAREGRLSPSDWVREGTDAPWMPAGSVQGLVFTAIASSAPQYAASPPPPPPPLVWAGPPATIPTSISSYYRRNPRRSVWPWLLMGAVSAVGLMLCCGIGSVILSLGTSNQNGGVGDPTVAKINVSGREATEELQPLVARLTDEQKVAFGVAALMTDSDIYAARVRITNTGDVPVRVFPENLRIHYGQASTGITTGPYDGFLQGGVLAPNYYFEGLVLFRAQVDIGAAIRLGSGAVSYQDTTIEVTYNN